MSYETEVLSIEELAAEARRFEATYGVASERLSEAFVVEGALRETSDFLRWDFVYGILLESGASAAMQAA